MEQLASGGTSRDLAVIAARLAFACEHCDLPGRPVSLFVYRSHRSPVLPSSPGSVSGLPNCASRSCRRTSPDCSAIPRKRSTVSPKDVATPRLLSTARVLMAFSTALVFGRCVPLPAEAPSLSVVTPLAFQASHRPSPKTATSRSAAPATLRERDAWLVGLLFQAASGCADFRM